MSSQISEYSTERHSPCARHCRAYENFGRWRTYWSVKSLGYHLWYFFIYKPYGTAGGFREMGCWFARKATPSPSIADLPYKLLLVEQGQQKVPWKRVKDEHPFFGWGINSQKNQNGKSVCNRISQGKRSGVYSYRAAQKNVIQRFLWIFPQ